MDVEELRSERVLRAHVPGSPREAGRGGQGSIIRRTGHAGLEGRAAAVPIVDGGLQLWIVVEASDPQADPVVRLVRDEGDGAEAPALPEPPRAQPGETPVHGQG